MGMNGLKQNVLLLIATLTLLGGTATAMVAVPLALPDLSQRLQKRAPKKLHSGLSVPRPVAFQNLKARGLVVSVWLNNTGPYKFAIDTGAGTTLISRQAAAAAGAAGTGGPIGLGGLSGVLSSTGQATIIGSVAIGERGNSLHPNQRAIIIDNLPAGIDGVMDPTDAYEPFGYTIDFPRGELSAFDPKINPLNIHDVPDGGTVVRWIFGSDRRPFVRLGDGRVALLDTGSGFGLAVNEYVPGSVSRRDNVSDLGGGQLSSRRGRPSTISIGAMTLRSVPTDFLNGAAKDAPLLLGRTALYPFRLTFDPVTRLIEIAPTGN